MSSMIEEDQWSLDSDFVADSWTVVSSLDSGKQKCLRITELLADLDMPTRDISSIVNVENDLDDSDLMSLSSLDTVPTLADMEDVPMNDTTQRIFPFNVRELGEISVPQEVSVEGVIFEKTFCSIVANGKVDGSTNRNIDFKTHQSDQHRPKDVTVRPGGEKRLRPTNFCQQLCSLFAGNFQLEN